VYQNVYLGNKIYEKNNDTENINNYYYNAVIFDDKNGKIVKKFKPYAYKLNENGKYISISGDRYDKIYRWTQNDIENNLILEHDVNNALKLIVQEYSHSDEISINRELYIDIEVDITNSLPDINLAQNKITAIAMYLKSDDKYMAFILDEGKQIKNSTTNNTEILSFDDEKILLREFLKYYSEYSPTVITGWNTDNFDIPYLINRIKNILNDKYVNTLSPVGAVILDEYNKIWSIKGVSLLDYMKIYKKFTFKPRSSYSLNNICKIEINKEKIKYDGTLKDLYNSDKNKYIEYNINDVILVVELNEKLKLLDLVYRICHIGHVIYEDIYYSSKYLEGSIITFLYNKNMISKNRPNKSDKEDFEGAFVMEPKPGLYYNVFSLDATSLYPSTIRTLNISPETKLFKIVKWPNISKIINKDNIEKLNKDYEELNFLNDDEIYEIIQNNDNKKIKGFDLKTFLLNNDVTISSHGVVYDISKTGVIPDILTKWFNDRVKYKTKSFEFRNNNDTENYNIYKTIELSIKTLLNSMYGVLGLNSFRFYDLDNALSVTLSGQSVIKYTSAVVDNYYSKKLKKDINNTMLYSDTDSGYFTSNDFIEEWGISKENEIEFTKELSYQIQKHINNELKKLSTVIFKSKNSYFDMKREKICKCAFFVAKKNYALHVVDDEGKQIDKISYAGLDVVRSSSPQSFKTLMESILNKIIKHDKKNSHLYIDDEILEYKNNIKNVPYNYLAETTGVKDIKKYETGKLFDYSKGAQAHIKGIINYNHLIKYFNLESKFNFIESGMKVKWVYLYKNQYNIDSLAYTDESNPPQILEIIEKYVDKEKMYETKLENKLKTFYEALNWEFPNNRTKLVNKFFKLK